MGGRLRTRLARRRRWVAALLAWGLALLSLMVRLPAAQAGGDILVTTTLDELTVNGQCSLREAVQAANTHSTVDTCLGHAGANVIIIGGTYVLTITKSGANDNTSGNLNLTSDITLGPLPCEGFCFDTTIKGAPGWDDQIILVSDNALVTLSALTIQGGHSAVSGGGVQVNGSTLVLTGTVLTDNTAATNGGGLYSNGSNTTIINSAIVSNAASVGGGWYGLGAKLELRGSTIMSNSAQTLGGGGIRLSSGAVLTISQSALVGNTADDNGGGLGMINSTASLVNVTVSGNRTEGHGGGLFVQSGSVGLNNVTVAYNIADLDQDDDGSGGGLALGTAATITLANSIVALNSDLSDGTVEPDCSGLLTSLGYNLIQNMAGCTLTGHNLANRLGIDPLLLPLVNSHGWVHPLHGLSPALDAGNPTGLPVVCAATDQRGQPRPHDGDGDSVAVCDIGAYEVQTTTVIRRVRLPLVLR